TDETEPLNVYGKTKLEGEKAIEESGCNYLIFRTSGLYSSFGNNFVKTIRRLLRDKDSISVVSDQVCTPTYAADLAALIVKIIEEGLYDYTGLYHFSNEGQCSWYEFALAIAELSDTYYNRCLAGENLDVKKDGNMRSICKIKPCSSAEYGARAQRPAYSVLDKSKVKETFWFEIPAWRESLRACIDRMKINY
ncbi:MAG: NAD(P)-dependent oxidoreductase, partial [Bacteroidales bacterium]|nr:NAD(P)-dependent oxidoreductase [Bacteroidales bacterium]